MISGKTPCFLAMLLLSTIVVGGCAENSKKVPKEPGVKEIDLSRFEDSKPEKKLQLLFIHHSCGGQLLADKGEVKEIVPDTTILEAHPNGGGLRTLLQRNNYEIHEAAYRSQIGDKTDVCDWNGKFRDKMEEILKCDRQDTLYSEASTRNDIIVFKSCFPNSAIESEGKEPGNPDSPERTIANYKAAYKRLLSYFKSHPDTLFVCVTAPPLVKNSPSRLKEVVKNIIAPEKGVKAVGERARRFNNWLKNAETGWLDGYEGKNVVVFDYYDVLTRHGESNHLLYPTHGGTDSHPSAEGNSIAAQEFVSFLNKSVARINHFSNTRAVR